MYELPIEYCECYHTEQHLCQYTLHDHSPLTMFLQNSGISMRSGCLVFMLTTVDSLALQHRCLRDDKAAVLLYLQILSHF